MEIGHRDKSVLEIRQNGIKLKRIKPNQLTWYKIEGNETKQNKTRVIELIPSVFYFEEICTSVVIRVGILNWSAFQ